MCVCIALTECRLTNVAFKILLDGLQKLPELRELDVNGEQRINAVWTLDDCC